jgi:hypothetical protein
MLNEGLRKLPAEGLTRARALLKLSTTEFSASRYNEPLNTLVNNERVFSKVTNHKTKGAYHNQIAIIFSNLAKTFHKKEEFLQRAVGEFKKADEEVRLARDPVFRATSKNNVGLILFSLSRFADAQPWARAFLLSRITMAFQSSPVAKRSKFDGLLT